MMMTTYKTIHVHVKTSYREKILVSPLFDPMKNLTISELVTHSSTQVKRENLQDSPTYSASNIKRPFLTILKV